MSRNLLTIHSALGGEPVDELEKRFAGSGYGDLKTDVADAFVDFAAPFRERALAYLDEPGAARRGAGRRGGEGPAIAEPTLATVYDRVGFLPAAP